MTDGTPTWVSERRVSELTGLALATLRNMRSLRRGIPYYKLGRAVRYREADVLAWCESQRVETRGETR